MPASPTAPLTDPVPDPSATASTTIPIDPALPTVTAPSTPLRPCVVLDSNVWVDIVVFDDPLARPIRTALAAGQLDAVISPSCREELRRVLAYPQFARFAVDIDAVLVWVDTVTRVLDPVAGNAPRLPRCSDADDQKFLELAQAAAARYLVSKDKAVLKLRRRMAQVAGVIVLKPADFVAQATLTA
ncbi:MAG TPA: putative toxin-antitoxin system toxin component, PIN family [Burkholderiaceae bacterium]|nr:putative toxin-antitoxin system toxin component, PIN family [Burkholderiaceae bacterium]